MAKRHTRNRRHKKRITRTRKMRGGAYSQTELQQLQTNGFSEYQIESLQEMNIPFNDVMIKINQLMNQGDDGFHGNSDEFAEQVMVEILNEKIFENNNSNISGKSGTGGKKGRKSRKQRGGTCYGNGVGANSYDPNYSIYNTNMLNLFPYKTR
jgi:hypothetical protein